MYVITTRMLLDMALVQHLETLFSLMSQTWRSWTI